MHISTTLLYIPPFGTGKRALVFSCSLALVDKVMGILTGLTSTVYFFAFYRLMVKTEIRGLYVPGIFMIPNGMLQVASHLVAPAFHSAIRVFSKERIIQWPKLLNREFACDNPIFNSS